MDAHTWHYMSILQMRTSYIHYHTNNIITVHGLPITTYVSTVKLYVGIHAYVPEVFWFHYFAKCWNSVAECVCIIILCCIQYVVLFLCIKLALYIYIYMLCVLYVYNDCVVWAACVLCCMWPHNGAWCMYFMRHWFWAHPILCL